MDLGRDLRLVIFDLDGTLIHLDVDWAALGPNPHPAAATAAELAGLGARRLDAATVAVLDALAPSYHLAVLSRNSRAVAERALAGLRANVMIIGREDCPRPKPDPSGVLVILSALGVRPEQAVLVGDTYHDVGAAHAAGLPAIVVHNGRLRYRPEGADAYVDSLAELPSRLKGMP